MHRLESILEDEIEKILLDIERQTDRPMLVEIRGFICI